MELNLEIKNMDVSNYDQCIAFCPECGSDLYFEKDGCYCKHSFKKQSDCAWICSNCQPRKCVYK